MHVEDGRTVSIPRISNVEKASQLRTDILRRGFNNVDADGDGTLSAAEISAYEDSVTTKPGAVDRLIGAQGQRIAGAPQYVAGDTLEAVEGRAKETKDEQLLRKTAREQGISPNALKRRLGDNWREELNKSRRGR